MEFIKRHPVAIGIAAVVLFILFYVAFSGGSGDTQSVAAGAQVDPNVAAAGAAVQQAQIAGGIRSQEIEAGLLVAEMAYAAQGVQSDRELQYSLENLAAQKAVALESVNTTQQYNVLQAGVAGKAINAEVRKANIAKAGAVQMSRIQAGITKAVLRTNAALIKAVSKNNIRAAKASKPDKVRSGGVSFGPASAYFSG